MARCRVGDMLDPTNGIDDRNITRSTVTALVPEMKG